MEGYMRISTLRIVVYLFGVFVPVYANDWFGFEVTILKNRTVVPQAPEIDEEPVVFAVREADCVKISIPMTKEAAHGTYFEREEDSLVVITCSRRNDFMMRVRKNTASTLFRKHVENSTSDYAGFIKVNYSEHCDTFRPRPLPASVVIDDRVRTTYENDALIIRLPTE